MIPVISLSLSLFFTCSTVFHMLSENLFQSAQMAHHPLVPFHEFCSRKNRRFIRHVIHLLSFTGYGPKATTSPLSFNPGDSCTGNVYFLEQGQFSTLTDSHYTPIIRSLDFGMLRHQWGSHAQLIIPKTIPQKEVIISSAGF